MRSFVVMMAALLLVAACGSGGDDSAAGETTPESAGVPTAVADDSAAETATTAPVAPVEEAPTEVPTEVPAAAPTEAPVESSVVGIYQSDIPAQELTAAWWQWALSEPAASNPLSDTTGEFCDRNQQGPVWYLAGSFGTAESRTCTVPAGVDLFFPVLNTVCDISQDCSGAFDGATTSVELDGLAIEPQALTSDPTVITTVAGNPIDGQAGPWEIVADGLWVHVPPLEAGVHQLDFEGTAGEFSLSLSYVLTVAE